MDPIFVRTARIIGEKGVDFLSTKTVAVSGSAASVPMRQKHWSAPAWAI